VKILLKAFGLSETVFFLKISKKLLKIIEASSCLIGVKSFLVKALDLKSYEFTQFSKIQFCFVILFHLS
jgi:hypothetical protein